MTYKIRTAACVGAVLLAGVSCALAQAQDPAAPTQSPSKWDKSAALGLTLTRGNSDTLLFTGNVLASRKAGRHEYNFGADATYGETEGETTAQNFHGFGQYNYLFTERAFGYFRLDGLHDDVAAIKYRFIASPGAGYYFIKATDVTLRGEVGPGFIYERTLRSNGEYEDKGYMTLRLAERYDHKLSDKVKLWQMVEFLPQVDRLENYLINAEIGVDTSLTPKLSLRTYLQDTYRSKPSAGREKNDLKLVVAIAYKF
jgi:putative salt-induced outer membrane protein YdiY